MAGKTDPGWAERNALEARIAELDDIGSVGDFVRARAKALGDQPAAIWFEDDVTLSYRQLDVLSDSLANGLLNKGLRKGAHVAVMLPNVAAFPVTWFALAKIGAVMIPVNSAYTGPELDYILNNSDAQALVIDGGYLGAFGAMEQRPEVLSDERVIVHGAAPEEYSAWEELADAGATFCSPQPIARTDLLNIQYTSGTTGFPKGCMQTHDYWLLLSGLAAFNVEELGVRRSLIWAPFFYMDPQWQFLMAMRLGATAYIARRGSLSRFFDWLTDFEIEYCAFPEPALGKFPVSDADQRVKLKYVNAFGWRPAAIAELETRFGTIARDSFGMTEIGAGSMMPKASTHMMESGSCGLPAPGREVRIVDDQGNNVPQGEAGELWVRGRSILWGYYKRPDANAESFQEGWFRTGDLFVQDENGYLRIVGRLKDMIKRSGENISAREVEAVLREMDEIEEAAIVPVPDPVRREEVKAYLMLKPGLSADDCPVDKVLHHCEARLATFKIPRYIAYVEDFPRTPSRKIAKRKLIAMTEDLTLEAFDRTDGVWK